MILWVTLLTLLGLSQGAAPKLNTEQDIIKFVQQSEAKLEAQFTKSTFAAWNFESNINEKTKKLSLAEEKKYALMQKEIGKIAQTIDTKKVKDKMVLRKIKMLTNLGTSVLPKKDLTKFQAIKAELSEIYSKAKVKEYNNLTKDYSLEPELTLAMAQIRDHEELEWYWKQWRQKSGKQMRDKYMEYIKIYNQAAKLNSFKDASDMKVVEYESDTFKQEMETTWLGLKPLYQQLHAYVRTKLNKVYGDKVVPKKGPLPAHLLGNMWAQQWNNLADILTPYPDKPSINVTATMESKNWTQEIMFEKAESFFTSIGLDPMPKEFWSGSILKKPNDGRDLVCHASAWDFANKKDFRIKQCTRVNQEDFVTVNHEMGHIQYYLQYKHQPFLFRNGANPGFHEGVADILSLAVGTATYFQRLGLMSAKIDVEDEQTNINILFNMALERIAFLPFGYLVDKFRWDVYSNVTSMENMNCHWWKLRHEIQGLKPPTKRSYKDFDAGAKYHVANDVGYVRYFTAFIYEFQFYRALCLASGQYDPKNKKKPLHRCNFYGSHAAGDKLKQMLKLGSSRPWKEAMKVMTGQPNMDTGAIREYFKPLEVWLKKENAKNRASIGFGKLNLNAVCEQSPGSQKSAKTSDAVRTGDENQHQHEHDLI